MYSSDSVAAAVCSCVFGALASAAVLARFRSRRISLANLGADDWLVVVAWVFALAYCCMVLYGSFAASIGQDLRTLTTEEYIRYRKLIYCSPLIAHLSYGFAKLSVLFFYKRIFALPNFHRVANVVVIIVLCWMLAATLVQVFSAWPISDSWTPGKSYSIHYGAFLTAFTALDLALDVFILCMPIRVIKGLQIDRKKKFMLMGVFWMGTFCVIATAVRLYFGYELSRTGRAKPMTSEQLSYISVSNIIWAMIEACCSVIAACLPCYAPLIKSFRLPNLQTASLRSLLRSMWHSTGSNRASRERESSGRGDSVFNAPNTSRDNWVPLRESNGSHKTLSVESEVSSAKVSSK